jgi:hypothetical protein
VEASLFYDFCVRTLANGAYHELVGVSLDQSLKGVVGKFPLKDRSRPVHVSGGSHLSREKPQHLMRVSIEGVTNFLKVMKDGSHANNVATRLRNLESLALKHPGRKL